MRAILLILFAALAGYGAFLIGQIEPGNYVKIYVASYLIELNLLSFIVLLLLSIITLYAIIRLSRIVWKAPGSYSKWRTRSGINRATQALGAGYLSLIKGDWQNAEKSLTSKSDSSRIPYVNYLAAAQAAQEQGRIVQRDDYLNAALKAAPKERLAIGLVKARLHQSAGQYDLAEATLLDVAAQGSKNAQYTAMLMQIYYSSRKWNELKALLSVARKQAALPPQVLEDYANQAYSADLMGSQNKEKAWKALPKNQRKRVENIELYASHLASNGEVSDAEKLIRQTLKNEWSEDLVHLYGSLNSDKPAKLCRVVEGWLIARPENAELNLAAGRLSLQANKLEQAKEYLQKAVEFGQLPRAYSLLGEAFEASNESSRALQLYRNGMLKLAELNDDRLIEEPSDRAQAASDGELMLVSKT